jgi:lipopolysaccharide assembly outer membrane protein LptD (OstA)
MAIGSANSIIKIIFIIFSFALLAFPYNQFSDFQSDSLLIDANGDSIITDTLQTDSINESSSKGIELEGPITYSASIVSVSRTGNKIYLQGDAKVIYQNLTLDAEKIVINQDNKTMFAEGVLDTIDSEGNPIYRGTPVFTERGEEPIRGITLFYEFETKRGKIGYGKTKMPPGYYRGEQIYKITDKTLFVEDGYFTSCEYIDNPHFYFRSPKMRVEVGEKVVARPVYLYIADVPLAVIPFGVFPNKKGRHSGIVIPSYGESAYGGRFLKNMGYYWAPNDYIDATLTTDYYEKLGFTFSGNINYVIRYILNGRVAGFYLPQDPNRPEFRNRWALQFSHTQIIDPTMRLAASGKFQSDGNLARDYASDYNRRVDQILQSNLTLSKKWTGTKNSMQFSLSRTENLQTGTITYTAPNLRFSRSQSSIYETITGETSSGKRSWYQQINFSYSGQLLGRGGSKKLEDGSLEKDERYGIQHNIALNSPQKIFKYFNIAPSISYNSIWVNETTGAEFDSVTKTVRSEKVTGFAVRRTYNGAISLNTTLFGLFEPNIGTLQFIRHKMDPSISFQFRPDFSDPSFGYFTEVVDSSGNIIKIDRFGQTAFSGTSRGKSQSMQISVRNFFQAKFVDGEEEKKLDLFTWNFSTGLNFLRDSLKWDNLSSNFSASPIKGVNITVSSQHSFYKRNAQGSGAVDKFRIPRLLNLNANMGFSLDQSIFKGSSDKKPDEESESEEGEVILEEEDALVKNEIYYAEEDVSDEFAASRISIPWRVNFNFNYNLNRSNLLNVTERFNIKARANITITKNWKLNWTGTYDVTKKDLVYQSISIYRDLHCWEMSFNWQPSVDYYSFKINVKADILQDLKLTKHPSGSARNVSY